MTKQELQDLDALRLRYLRTVFDNSHNGLLNAYVGDDWIDQQLGLDPMMGRLIRQYLTGVGLLQSRGIGAVSMTHAGNMEIEDAVRGRETPHFPLEAVNVVVMGNITNSQVQVATTGSTQTQQIFSGSNLQELTAFVADMAKSLGQLGLSADDEAALHADIESMGAQLKSPKPRPSALRDGLTAVRDALTKAVATAAAGAAGAIASTELPRLLAAADRVLHLIGG